jgi:hypothetical protein
MHWSFKSNEESAVAINEGQIETANERKDFIYVNIKMHECYVTSLSLKPVRKFTLVSSKLKKIKSLCLIN